MPYIMSRDKDTSNCLYFMLGILCYIKQLLAKELVRPSRPYREQKTQFYNYNYKRTRKTKCNQQL